MTRTSALRELALVFLRLGATSFGGPAVHIALMEEEFVTRRKWLERQEFLDLVGATNVIPGPNSTEVAIHIGYLRAGLPGLLIAGICFILPAALLTLLMAFLYVRYGALPQAAPFLRGVQPVVLAVLVAVVWRLGRTAVKNGTLAVVGAAVLAASLVGLNELAALFGGGILGMLALRRGKRGAGTAALLTLGAGGAAQAAGGAAAAGGAVGLWPLGLFFLKVGSLLYGSGYVLVAFLEGGLVAEHGWLTQQQLLDAVAAGQFTPGPLFSTATFVGYQIGGLSGALVATAGIFLPSFCFVAALAPLLPRLRRLPGMAAFLDAVNVASLALMAAVAARLAVTTLTDWPAWVILAAAALLGIRGVNSAWLVLGGGLLGFLLNRISAG